jgi:hypothetical protein
MNSQSPYQQGEPGPQTTSILAVISLVMGILGWIGMLGIGPLVAIIAGHMAKNEIRESIEKYKTGESRAIVGGNGIATAGLVLGYLNLALIAIGLCLVVIIIFALGGFAVFVQMFGGG